MRTVKFISGVTSTEFILNQNYEIAIKECNPWQSKWTYESIEEQYGVTLASFTKSPLELDLALKFRGTESGISDNLNQLFEECERDVINMAEGRLYVDDEYISGYFIDRQTVPTRAWYGYEQTLRFFAPYPFWIQELTREFYPESGIEAEGLNYNYNYNYNYSLDEAGARSWDNNHYAPSEFKMTIFGATENPRVGINGHPYQVNVTLDDGEYLEIDSRQNTITGYQNNGQTSNLYKFRNTAASVFEKIPAGNNLITWNGTFGFNITQYLERSEPRWS